MANFIKYSFEIKNTGNLTLKNIKLIDDKLGNIICSPKDILLPGEILKCTLMYTITAQDIAKGYVFNTAKVIAQTPQGQIISSIDSEKVFIKPSPSLCALSISKKASTKVVTKPFQKIKYSFIIKNNSKEVLYNVSIFDPKLCVKFNIPKLEPEELRSFYQEYTITRQDMSNKYIVNTVFASATWSKGHLQCCDQESIINKICYKKKIV